MAQVLRAARQRPTLVGLCILVALGVAFGLHSSRTPVYEAEAKVLFRATNLDSAVLGGSRYFVQSVDPARTAATNLEVTRSHAIAERVAGRMDGVSADEVRAHVLFAQQGGSDVVAITGADRDAQRAATFANLWSEELVAFRRETDQRQIEQAIELVDRELRARGSAASSPDVVQLRGDLDKLRLLQTLQTGDVQVLEAAVPPKHATGTTLGVALGVAGIAGALVGLLAAVALAVGDRRIRTVDQATDAADMPVLAVVPKFSPQGTRGSRGTPAGVTEAFRGLSLRLRFFNVDRERKLIAVVSCNPSEGKSTVSLNLALVSVAAGRRTLLVDCDLRRGQLAQRLGVEAQAGLTEVLSGQLPLRDVIVSVPQPGPAPGSLAELAVLPRGAVPPNPTEMLASAGFGRLLKQCGDDYDFVVIDTAPLLAVPDTEALLASVDSAVMVVRAGQTVTRDIAAVQRGGIIERTRFLGVVLNGQTLKRQEGGYYGYGDAAVPVAARDAGRGDGTGGTQAARVTSGA